MQTSIESKLADLLAQPIDTEPKAVYLLCQMRKLQDYDGTKSGRLRMFCNWAVHVDLGMPKTIEDFLKDVDEVVGYKLSGLDSIDSMKAENKLTGELALFDTCRDELRECLRYHHLPTTLCDDDAWWYGFLEQYSGVIEDCTMTLKKPLQHIAALRFERRPTSIKPAALSFAPTWVVTLRQPHQGRRRLEISAEQFAGLATKAWGYRLT
jgi:hypothetical protein